jgi:hypothetical protein
MRFDGAGGGSSLGTFARSDGAVNPADNHPFIYAVSADCTFTFSWLDDGETYAGVIESSGYKLDFIETSGGCCGTPIVRRGYASRIGLGVVQSCSNGTLRGTYGFSSTVSQNNEVPPHFLELEGLFSFDGNEHAASSYTYASSGGAVGADSVSLTYQVDRDCRFSMSQDNGETYSGVITEGGQAILFIETTGACCGSAIIRRGRGNRLTVNTQR